MVAKDYSSKSVMASVVPVKGSSHEFPAKRINAFIRELGLEAQELVLRNDQEPALQDLLGKSVADVSQPRHSTRSLLWDRQLRTGWPKEVCRLLKGRFEF